MQNTFEKAVNEMVTETLNEIFTPTATRVIYNHLEMNYHLKPETVAQNIDTFRKGLEKFLSTGALAVEGIIVKRLYGQFRLKYENRKDWTFMDYMNDLKTRSQSQ